MKKLTFFLVALMMTVLAACGGGGGDAEEVYQKAMQAGEKLESAEMDIKIKQTMDAGELMGTVTMEMDSIASVIVDPFAMYQKGSMAMEMEGFPIEMETEMYMVDSDFYMYDSMSDMWIKMGADMMPTEMMNMEQNPHEQLEILESFLDDIEFKEESDYYVFIYDGDGKDLVELSKEIIKENLDDDTLASFGMEMEEVFDQMNIHSLYYEIQIDKKTYDTKSVITNMDFEIDVDGESMAIQQEMNATYTGINTIDKIEVPQEVIDEAQEF